MPHKPHDKLPEQTPEEFFRTQARMKERNAKTKQHEDEAVRRAYERRKERNERELREYRRMWRAGKIGDAEYERLVQEVQYRIDAEG